MFALVPSKTENFHIPTLGAYFPLQNQNDKENKVWGSDTMP